MTMSSYSLKYNMIISDRPMENWISKGVQWNRMGGAVYYNIYVYDYNSNHHHRYTYRY